MSLLKKINKYTEKNSFLVFVFLMSIVICYDFLLASSGKHEHIINICFPYVFLVLVLILFFCSFMVIRKLKSCLAKKKWGSIFLFSFACYSIFEIYSLLDNKYKNESNLNAMKKMTIAADQKIFDLTEGCYKFVLVNASYLYKRYDFFIFKNSKKHKYLELYDTNPVEIVSYDESQIEYKTNDSILQSLICY